ncbi:MAG: DHHA1 domain-containing protein, partial [Nitrososphaerales archaeon]
EKLIESFRKTLEEADTARKRLRTVIKALAPEVAKNVVGTAKQLGKVKLFSTYDEVLDEDYHIAVGERAIEKESSLVYCALVQKGRAIRVIVFVGEQARASGIRAGDLAKRVANMLGGSGGGDERFGQGGGRSVERLKEALLIVEELVRK